MFVVVRDCCMAKALLRVLTRGRRGSGCLGEDLTDAYLLLPLFTEAKHRTLHSLACLAGLLLNDNISEGKKEIAVEVV